MKTLQERFDAKWTPEPNTGCWLWTGATVASGYGTIWDSGKTVKASRLSWRLANGDPGRLHVLHRCDVPRCVNPKHLFLGTHEDNMADRNRKGRMNPARGAAHVRALLTEEQAVLVRALYDGGMTQAVLAERFGVAQTTVSKIIRRASWTHL
jgi:hypothetical protein